MLEAEIDVFSGMPNPTFELSEKEEKELLDRVVAGASQLSPAADSTQNFGLGYRGVIVRQIKTDAGPWSATKRPKDLSIAERVSRIPGRLPDGVSFGHQTARGESIAAWLLKIAERKRLAIND